MLAVLFCSLFNGAMLIGLGSGIAAGVWQARDAVATALAGEPFAVSVVRAPAAGREGSPRGCAVPHACPAG